VARVFAVLMIGVLALWIDAMPQLDRSASGAPVIDTPCGVARAAVTASVETRSATRQAPTSSHMRSRNPASDRAAPHARCDAGSPRGRDRDFWSYVENDVQAVLRNPASADQWNANSGVSSRPSASWTDLRRRPGHLRAECAAH
jgi:hypothetical protein